MLTACIRAQTLLRGWGEEFGSGFEDQWPECCRKPEEMIRMVRIDLRRLFSAFEWSAPFIPSTDIPLSENTSHIQASAAELKDKLTFSLSTQAGYKGKGNRQIIFEGEQRRIQSPGIYLWQVCSVGVVFQIALTLSHLEQKGGCDISCSTKQSNFISCK